MSNYPKALEEFLNTVPKNYKKRFDQLSNTPTYKKNMGNLSKLDKVSFDEREVTKKLLSGKALFKNDKLNVILTQGLAQNKEKNALIFSYILMHELVHICQKVSVCKAKDVELNNKNSIPPENKRFQCEVIAECHADNCPMKMILEARLHNNKQEFEKVEEYLEEKYEGNIGIDSNYDDMKKAYSKVIHKRIKKDANNQIFSEVIRQKLKNIPDNFSETISDKEVLEYENMILTGKTSAQINFEKNNLINNYRDR